MAIHFGVIWKLWRIIITLSNYYCNCYRGNYSLQWLSSNFKRFKCWWETRQLSSYTRKPVDKLEHDWAGQLEHRCWQTCSCMLELLVHTVVILPILHVLSVLTELTSTFDQLSLSFDRCFWNQNSPRKYLIMQEKNQCSCTKIILDNHLAWKLI